MQVQLSREHRYADVARAVAAQLQLQNPERLRFTHHNSYQDVRPSWAGSACTESELLRAKGICSGLGCRW